MTVIAVFVQMSSAVAQPAPSHVLSGIVVDSATGTPVAGIQVQVLGATQTAQTGPDGRFVIDRVPGGTIQLRVTHVGYEPRTVTLVMGPGAESTPIRIEIRTRVIPQPPITVIGEATRIIAVPGHSTTLTAERLRRNPGSLSDVSRAVSRIPEVTPLMDVLNLYSVRGGAPLENGFNIDGIDLPDISHLPNQGSTGGAVGLINPEFVEEVRLHSGAFDAAYGGRMSSILEVDWRNPRTDAWHGTADFSAAGARLSVDGPISTHASLMVSAHHSYLDRLLDESGLGVSPRFNDYQGKFHLRFSDRQSLAAIGLLGVDNFEVSRENAMDAGGGVYYGEWDALPHAVGVTWDAAWSDRLATRAVVSRAVTSFDYHFWDIQTSRETYLNKSTEATLTARGDLLWKISGRLSLRGGMEWKRFSSDVLNEDRSLADRYGRFVRTAVLIDRHYEDGLAAVYSSLTAQVGGGLEVGLGGRI
ncbi:MAG: TonB-dependent receptor [Candidatus Zixiibacteriota bacterium]